MGQTERTSFLTVGAPQNFQLTGQVNQAVQIYRDDDGDGITAEASDFDRRSSVSLYVREQGQLFGKASLADIGVSQMDAIAYRFPISTGADLKINRTDTQIKASGSGYPADVAPFSGMSITYHATPQAISGLTGGPYNFGIVIEANGRPLQDVYNFVQYALRQSSDINSSTPPGVTGKIADPLLTYVGDTLYTLNAANPEGGGTGVFIANFASTDQNAVIFRDNTTAERSYPYVATLTLSFGENLVSDGGAKYWVYYSTTPGGDDWGEASAILVNDASAAPMSGAISAATALKTYDFDGNTQGGRVPPAVPAITAVAIGLSKGQYVRASGSIARSKANSIALVAPLERNYANP
jgi:hypothetical protein